jgi:hypothetical protein
MPSNLDPALVVNPGPGRVPAGSVPAGALVPPGGGGGGSFAALQVHIHNPKDAHMAHAIGVDPYYPYNVPPPTPDPILTSVGGPVDGESVLDFIDEFKDLIPPHPNFLGYNAATYITNGIPAWGHLDPSGTGTGTALTGGYANGSNVQFTHYLVPNGTTTFQITGILYPADRGVLALYKNTSGNFLDSANTTLVAAIWLGDVTPTPPPAGIPHPPAGFDETVRRTQQVPYTASGVGFDQISLSYRYPYLKDYTGYAAPPVPYGPFPTNFFRFQLANFAINAQSVGTGDSQNWLLVHWRETYAVTLAAIQPSHLTLANLTGFNCYSATPTSNTAYASGSWDDNTIAAFNVNRHFVFLDTNSATVPSGGTFTNTVNGSPTTVPLSGVQFYSVPSGAGSLTWNVDITGNNLFANSFQTGSSDNPPHVPALMHGSYDPIQMNFTYFGGVIYPVPYYAMKKQGGSAYDYNNSPQPSDVGEYVNTTLAIAGPTNPSSPAIGPGNAQRGYSPLIASLRNGFNEFVFDSGTNYLWNSFAQTGGGTQATTVLETFTDEHYRYPISFNPKGGGPFPLVPSSAFASSTPFTSASGGTAPYVTPQQNDLQVIGSGLIYPQVDYASGFAPSGQPNYATVQSGDGGTNLRRYMRCFDTGVPRNVGKLRIYGVPYSAFQANAAYNGTETTGHVTGGVIIQILVPGATGTGWLDLGRAYGDPGLATNDFYGCSTAVVAGSGYVDVTYNTTAFTYNNGSGQFPIFVRITYLNNAAGLAAAVTAVQWMSP